MGEARRRKYGADTGGPGERFRVPRDSMAITIKIHDENPTTLLFGSDTVAQLVRIVEQTAGRPPYDDFVREVAAAFITCKRADADLTSVGAAAMWTALYHPQIGAAMRAAVPRELRDKGTAHISWHLSEKGLAMALADRFIDLDGPLAEAGLVVVGYVPGDKSTSNQVLISSEFNRATS